MPTSERVLALLLVAAALWCVLALSRRRRPGLLDTAVAALLLAGSLLWLFGSPAYEGPTIVVLTASRGLSVADLGVPPGLALGAAVLWTAWRDRRPD